MTIAKKYEDVVAERDALQQRLAVAEQLLREVIHSGEWNSSALEFTGCDGFDLLEKIDAALKPAVECARCMNCDRTTVEQCDDAGCGFLGAGNGEPSAEGDSSSPEFTKKEGKSARIPSGLKKDQIVEVFGGGQTQIARVDKTDWRHVEMWRIKP